MIKSKNKSFLASIFILCFILFVNENVTAAENNKYTIPILMYHSIGHDKGNGLVMPPEKFKSQMKYLKDEGYKTITLNELYEIFNNNREIPDKTIVITLDDGYADNYKYAYPAFKEFGIKATIFVITNYIDKSDYYLNSQQIKELQANGINIEAHTKNHEDLTTLTYDKQLMTLRDSRLTLEKLLNKQIRFIAYPYGRYNSDTIKAASEAGYSMGFTTKGSNATKSNGIYTIKRKNVNSSEDMNAFINKLKR